MRVTVHVSRWACDDHELPGGTHEVDKPSKKLLHHLAAAEAAGVLSVDASEEERTVMAAHIEPDDVSLARQQAAVEDGSWRLGNLAAFVADRTDRLAYDDSLDGDHEDKLVDAERARHERELLQAQGELDAAGASA